LSAALQRQENEKEEEHVLSESHSLIVREFEKWERGRFRRGRWAKAGAE